MIALRFALSIIQSPYQNPAKIRVRRRSAAAPVGLLKWVLIVALMRSE
jgi:hypothetical protein